MGRLPPHVDAAIHRYRAALEAEFPTRVQRVIVFGSVARGEATEDSDVDVLVLFDTLTFRERGRAMDLLTEVGFEHDLVMAPVVLSAAEWAEMVTRERRFPREVLADGVVL